MIKLIFIVLMFQMTSALYAQKRKYNIYFDADFSHHKESSESIRKGFILALKETKYIDYFNFIKLDHRGNSRRSKSHLSTYQQDPDALLIVSGIHSPPLLAHKEFINQNKILHFVPWAAAGPITRSRTTQNWIFRLSLDDSKAGKYIVNYGVKSKGFKKPCLLLEGTGWGKNNFKEMTKEFSKNNIQVNHTEWFKWGIGNKVANKIALTLKEKKCDSILLVANANEGKVLIRAIAKNSSIPIISHWGITGGNFHNEVPHKLRNKVKLEFIQTSYNFFNPNKTPYQVHIDKKIKTHYPTLSPPTKIPAATGFIHAYDLGTLFVKALSEIDLSAETKEVKSNIKKKITSLRDEVQGLIKLYKAPFTIYRLNEKDAHEALDIEDYAIGYYDSQNDIRNKVWKYKK